MKRNTGLLRRVKEIDKKIETKYDFNCFDF